MNEFIEILSGYVPELMTATIGGISIGTVVYLIKFIVKKLEAFRKDPGVDELKRELRTLCDQNRALCEQNEKLRRDLSELSDSVHHIYRG